MEARRGNLMMNAEPRKTKNNDAQEERRIPGLGTRSATAGHCIFNASSTLTLYPLACAVPCPVL
jgi:hypothetical protein